LSIDYPVPEIKQLGRGGERDLQILPAIEPLDHHSKQAGRIGFALTFAKEYLSHVDLGSKKILIIPGGRGATSFLGGNWNKGDFYYEDAVYRTNYVLHQYPGSTLKAILWHQGESDYFNDRYEHDLDNFISDIRSDIDGNQGNVPFILGGMVPRWIESGSAQVRLRKRTLQNIIHGVEDRVKYTGFADSEHPDILKYNYNDELIHFDAWGQRELGKRYFRAYLYALSNDLSQKAPEKIDNLKAIGKNGKFTLKWFAPRGNHAAISGYFVEYKRKGSAFWIGRQTEQPGIDIDGLENGVLYDVRVSAINGNGVSAPSNIVQASPHSAYSECIFHLTFDDVDFSNECGQASVLGGTGFKIWNGDYSRKWYIAESRTHSNGIRISGKIHGDYTKMLWFKVNLSGNMSKNQHLISSLSGDKHALMITPDGRLSAGHNNVWNEVETPSSSISSGVWYHGAVTYNSYTRKLKLYLNGEKMSENATTEIGVANIQIGNFNGDGIIGQIADVRIYDTSLTDTEIRNIYLETVSN